MAAATSSLLLLTGCTAPPSEAEPADGEPAGYVVGDIPPQDSSLAVSEEQIQGALDRLPELARAMLEKTGLPGLSVAVTHGGETVFAEGYGVREAGTDDLVDADTVFQIASLSKPVGATVVATQVSQGVVGWDTPVVDNLPDFALADPWVTEHVTIGDLYAHRSGLPDHAGDDLEDLGFDRAEITARLDELPLAPFRATYFYTNQGLTAAAESVAVASGTDWDTLSEQQIYTPLGMTNTSSRYADFLAADNRATLHSYVDGEFEALVERNPDPESPAGGVSSTANDMAAWMNLVLGNGTVDGVELIDPSSLLPAISSQSITPGPPFADARGGYYGFGFNVGASASGRVTLSHSGAFSSGAATNFVMIPSLDIGIVVLTNGAPVGAAEALAMEFADLVQYGSIKHDWYEAYNSRLAPLNAPAGDLVGLEQPADAAPPAESSVYVGEYASGYFGSLTVTDGPEGLSFTIGPENQEYALTAWDGDTFAFEPSSENATVGSVSSAVFTTSGDAPASSLVLTIYNEHGLGVFSRVG